MSQIRHHLMKVKVRREKIRKKMRMRRFKRRRRNK
jgi:hypothetical protein